MSIFALLRRLERISRPAPSLAHDYDLPVQDVELSDYEAGYQAGAANEAASQPSPVTTRTSAGDRSAAAGTLPPTAAAEPLTWLGWAVPAILDVLAEHEPRLLHGVIACGDHAAFVTHCDWSEHVAPLLAERIGCDPARAIAALKNFQPK